MGLTPVRSAWRSSTGMTARTRSASGADGPLPCSSSSLMKSTPASGELADEFAELVGGEADAGLDDRADHRPVGSAHEPACSLDSERGSGVPLGESERKLEVDELDRGELLDLEEIAGDGCQQVRKRGAEVGEGEAQSQDRPAPIRRIADRAGERRRTRERDLLDALHLRGEPRAQVVRLPRDAHERAGGLLAGEDLGGPLQRQRRLDHVGRDDVRGAGRRGHHTTGIHTDISDGPRLPHAKYGMRRTGAMPMAASPRSA